MKRRILPLLLAVLLVVGLLPATAFATEGDIAESDDTEAVEPSANTAPTLREGVKEEVKVGAYEGIAWELDLSTIFTDADGDALTYKVKIGSAEAVAAEEKFSCTVDADTVLVFTANDGKVDSTDTYTVTLYYNAKPTLLKESGTAETTVGETVSIPMSELFTASSTSMTFLVSVNDGEEEAFANTTPRNAYFKRAFEKAGTYTLKFRANLGPLYSDVCTYTLTVTGEDVTNHAPYLLDTAAAEAPTGPMWTSGVTGAPGGTTLINWRPDLTKVFADEDGYETLSFTYRDDLMTEFRTFYTGESQPGYAVGSNIDRVGERTVTIRATDPYGCYVDYTVNITVKEDHKAVRKAGVEEAYTFEVPFGATLTLNADDYFEDTDSKDVDNVKFNIGYKEKTYSYTASDPANDLVVEMYGFSGSEKSVDSITFTFRTVMPESWPTLTALTVDTLYGTANTAGTATGGDVTVSGVTIIQYDTLRVTGGKASAGVIIIRADEDVDGLERTSYELSGNDATGTVSTGATIGAELADDITLNATSDYRNGNAVSINLPISSEQYGNYTLTVYYDLAVAGSNTRPILAISESAKREKITLGTAWTINLTGIFSDADNDPLTYKVSVNGAEAATIEGSTYTITPEDGVHTLVFTASDGKVESKDTYTVTLLTRNPGAPDWPQILEYNVESLYAYKGTDSTTYPTGNVSPASVKIVQYEELLSDGSRTYAGEILIYVAEDINSVGRNWYRIDAGKGTGKTSNGATLSSAKITMRKLSSYTSNSDLYVMEDGEKYYYYVKMVVAAFTPAIGNGAAAGTTADGVTTFAAGTDSAAPTVTVTAPASGWAVGENTFTVACDKACVVMVKSGDTYTKLAATNTDTSHSFTATLASGDQIIVRLKGDVNGDGKISAVDSTLVSRACLSESHAAYQALDALAICANGTPNASIAVQIGRACLTESHAAYQPMAW